jgi:primosomal protein N'
VRFGTVVPLVTARALGGREFTYELPDGAGKGAVVSVPFGRSRARGVVVEVVDAPPVGVRPLPVEKVVHELPATLIDLALWLAEYYGSTPARALELVAPVRRARRKEQAPPGSGSPRGRGGPGASATRRSRPSRGWWTR